MKLVKTEWKNIEINQAFFIVWNNSFDIQFGDFQTGVGVELAYKRDNTTYLLKDCICIYIEAFPNLEFDMYVADNRSINICNELILLMKHNRKDATTESGTEVLETITEFCKLLLQYRKEN